MDGTLTLPLLRNVIDKTLLSDSAFEAFVLDHFPHVKRLYGCGMDRTQKVNLLFEQADCEQIYENLRHRYPQAAAYRVNGSLDAKSTTPPDSGEPSCKETRRFFLVLTGTIDELDEPKIKALVAHIRKVSGDAELTLEAIKAGSIVLQFKGTAEGLERLQEAFKSGELQEILGHSIECLGMAETEAHRPPESPTSKFATYADTTKVALPVCVQVASGKNRRWRVAAATTLGALFGMMLALRGPCKIWIFQSAMTADRIDMRSLTSVSAMQGNPKELAMWKPRAKAIHAAALQGGPVDKLGRIKVTVTGVSDDEQIRELRVCVSSELSGLIAESHEKVLLRQIRGKLETVEAPPVIDREAFDRCVQRSFAKVRRDLMPHEIMIGISAEPLPRRRMDCYEN